MTLRWALAEVGGPRWETMSDRALSRVLLERHWPRSIANASAGQCLGKLERVIARLRARWQKPVVRY
jgi:hypothetical protein